MSTSEIVQVDHWPTRGLMELLIELNSPTNNDVRFTYGEKRLTFPALMDTLSSSDKDEIFLTLMGDAVLYDTSKHFLSFCKIANIAPDPKSWYQYRQFEQISKKLKWLLAEDFVKYCNSKVEYASQSV